MTRFVAPNTCQVPNDFFDVLLPLLGDAEVRVLLYLMRQTFGWNRDWTVQGYGRIDKICEGAGLSRQGAINALKGLKERGAIESRKAGVAFEYRVRVHDVDTSTDQRQPVNVVDRPDVQSTTLTDIGQRGGLDPVNVVDREPVNVVDRIKRQSSKPTENPNRRVVGGGGPVDAGADDDAPDAAAADLADSSSSIGQLRDALCAGMRKRYEFMDPKRQPEVDSAARALQGLGATPDEIAAAADHWWETMAHELGRTPGPPRAGQLSNHLVEVWRKLPPAPLFNDDPADYSPPDLAPWTPVAAAPPAPPTEAEDLWQRILTELRLQMTPATYAAWLKDTHGERFDEVDGSLVVQVPSEATRDWLTSRLGNVLRETVAKVAGADDTWRFVVAEREAVVA